MPSEKGEVKQEEEQEESLLDKIIGAIASFYESLGVSEEDAENYAAWTFWSIVAVIVLIAALKLYRLIRGY